MPSGIDEFVIKDFDAALEIAQRHNIGINFVLLDFRFMYDAQMENGVQLGGHAAVLATPAGQEALVHNVFDPIFRKYANNPAILSWEVMNEPEWTLRDAGTVHKEVSQPLTLADFRAFAKLTIKSIHSIAGSYATIGGADMKWAQNWMGLGLDYYQVHFYDWISPYSTDNLFTMRAESLRLDRPWWWGSSRPTIVQSQDCETISTTGTQWAMRAHGHGAFALTRRGEGRIPRCSARGLRLIKRRWIYRRLLNGVIRRQMASRAVQPDVYIAVGGFLSRNACGWALSGKLTSTDKATGRARRRRLSQ